MPLSSWSQQHRLETQDLPFPLSIFFLPANETCLNLLTSNIFPLVALIITGLVLRGVHGN